MRKMGDVGHPVGAVVAERFKFLLIFVGRDDHDVRANMKFRLARMGFASDVWNPGANVHVGDTHAIDMRLLSSKTLFYPTHERGIEAAGFVVVVPREGGETAPPVRAFAKDAVFTTRRRGPIEKRGVLRYKCWAGA